MDKQLIFLFLAVFTVTVYSNCSVPSSVTNAYFRPLNSSYAENDTVQYTCNGSFIISGNTQLECTGTAWVGSLPTCIPVCPATELPNSYIVSSGPYHSGVVITYKCQAGFIMYGSATRTCDSNYKWTGNPPSCNQQDLAPHIKNSENYVYAPDGYVSAAPNQTETYLIEDEGVIPVIVFGVLLGLLLLGMIIFLIIRICCCGDMCNCCGPGSKCSGFGACCMGCCGLGQTAGYSVQESGTGCCGCCRKGQVKYNKIGQAKKQNAIAAWQEKRRKRSQTNPPYNELQDPQRQHKPYQDDYYQNRQDIENDQLHYYGNRDPYNTQYPQDNQYPGSFRNKRQPQYYDQPRYYSPASHFDHIPDDG